MDDSDIEQVPVERLARGHITQVLAVASVADEDQPRHVALAVDDDAQAATEPKLLPRGDQVRNPLRPSTLVRFAPLDHARIGGWIRQSGKIASSSAISVPAPELGFTRTTGLLIERHSAEGHREPGLGTVR